MPTDKSPVDEIKAKAIEADVVEAIRTIFDPELPVNIYDLGLIYGIDVTPDGVVTVRMTLTAPTCPVAESLPPAVEVKVKSVASVTDAKVELVWDPPWTPERMSEAARLELNFDIAPSPSKFFNVDLPPR